VSPSDQNESGPASAQALSDSLKEAVKSWVPKVRKALDDEFGAQLERLGLRRNGTHVALDEMSLPAASVAVRRRIEALVARESLSEGTPERGYDNVIRELTYTLLNRLVGLKAMEARKLLYLPPPGRERCSRGDRGHHAGARPGALAVPPRLPRGRLAAATSTRTTLRKRSCAMA
jgi:hypothetical protein